MSWTRYDANSQPLISTLGTFPGIRGLQTFSANGTYTPTAGTRAILVLGVGAGGGGGGCNVGTAANVSVSGGGGSGAYVSKFISGPNTTYAIVCGIGGGSAAANNGGVGTQSTFGATVLVCPPGAGGIGAQQNAITAAAIAGGIGGTLATGGDINSGGEPGLPGIRGTINTFFCGGHGAPSQFGAGGTGNSTNGTGSAAVGWGAGGGGAASNSTSSFAGGTGANGFFIIYEYS